MMAKIKDVHSPEKVSEFIQGLEPAVAELVQAIRQVIVSVDPSVGEQIKWNSPAFFYTGEMNAFNAKEYKRDLLVINLSRGKPLLVFPTGATIADKTGVLEGDYKDGRRMMTINNLDELKAKKDSLKTVIKTWLNQVE